MRTGRKLRGNPWAVLAVVSLGFFMTLLDLTIVNIAIPNMITKLHASLDDVLWVLNTYALVLAVLVITAGRLGDLLGPRTMFAAGITVFTVASAACGFAPGPGALIAFRAVQGLGAAMLMPQTMAVTALVFPPDRRGTAFGVSGAVAGCATVAGPPLGGLLVTALGWRWIFFVNLPIGAIVLVSTFAIIPDLRPSRGHRLDIRGVMLASLALLAICFALVEGQRYDWGKISGLISIPLIAGLGVVLLALFIIDQALRQKGEREPLIQFELFRNRNYTLMNWLSCAMAIGMMGMWLPLTIYFQSALGFSALKCGLTIMPALLMSIVLAPGIGELTDKIGGKYILVCGLSLTAVGMGWAVLVTTPHSAWYDFLAPLIVAGIGMACTYTPLATTAMREIEPGLAGAASGGLSMTRQVGSVMGTAVVGALLQNRMVAALTSEATTRSRVLPPRVRAPFVSEFRQAASSGLVGGSGSSTVKAPAGTQPSLAAEFQRLGAEVFTSGYIHAMRWTMLMPVAVLGLAAVSCFGIRRVTSSPTAPPATETKQMTGARAPEH
jgi:EmrB/QacA subfamily drug resistance transporter